MDVFVTGATGALGRLVVQRLFEEGHRVRALARSEANAGTLREARVEPVTADLFNLDSMTRTVAGSDAVLHLATRIPPAMKVRSRKAWAENDRIRGIGTRNVVDAALANGVGTVLYHSFYAVYADGRDRWIEADSSPVDPLWFLETNMEAEAHIARFASTGGRGISLRMGWFLGLESSQTMELLGYARHGFAMVPGSSEAYVPSIWVHDTAEAVMAALRAPSGVYDVVDDEPLTRAEYAEALAAAVGRKRLRRPPMFLMRLFAGSAGEAMGRSMRISNRRFKDAAGWAPSVRSAREGYARLAAGVKADAGRSA